LYITFHLLFKPAHFIFSLNSWRLDIYIPDHRLIYFEGIFIWSSYIRVSKCWPAGMQVCTYNSTLRDWGRWTLSSRPVLGYVMSSRLTWAA
jgi:hypothetical protein